MDENRSKALKDAAFTAHEREQILAKARQTTPTQRVHWVEQAFELFAPQIAEAQRREPKRYF